jgi:hypothetical protein
MMPELCDRYHKQYKDIRHYSANIMNSVMYVIDNIDIEMLKRMHEKGKLVERPGRKATNLRLPRSGGYGSRATMEKIIPCMLIFLAPIIKSGGNNVEQKTINRK